jgi:hypothetical protein
MEAISADKVRTYDGDTIDWIKDSDGANPSLWFGSEAEYAAAHPAAGATPQAMFSYDAGLPGLLSSQPASQMPLSTPSYVAAAAQGAQQPQAQPDVMTPPQTGGPLPVDTMSPPQTQQQLEAAAGIQDMGNNMVFVPSYGGVVDRNSPWYTQAMSGATPGGPNPAGVPGLKSSGQPGAPAVLGPYGAMYDALMADSPVDSKLQGVMGGILDDPESLNDNVVGQMKAQSKDELSEMQAMDDQELQQTGAQMGISDSPWLASERLASRRDRDRALVGKNRDIDIQAATTNAADRRSAASLGLSYTGQKASQRQSAMALSAQVLMHDIDNATQRYGIDTGAGIDRQKLAMMDDQFKQELAFKLKQLQQLDDQFAAQFGMSVVEFQHKANMDNMGLYLGSGTGA